MSCANFSDVTSNGKFVNPEFLNGTSGTNQGTALQAETMLNTAYQVAGGVGQSPCVTELRYAQMQTQGLKTNSTYLPNQEVPTNCINPVMANVLNTFVPAVAAGNLVTRSYKPEGDKNLLGRLDYHPDAKNSFDLRYNYIHSNTNAPAGVNSASQGIATYALLNQQAHSNFGNVGWTSVLSPSLLNEMRVGYKRFEYSQLPQDNRTLNSFGGQFSIPGIPTLPEFNFSNEFALGAASSTAGANQGYSDRVNENVEVLDRLTYTRGNHTIQGGFEFLRLQYLNRSDYPGLISYSTTFTGVSFGDGLLGLVSTLQAQNRLIQGGIQHDLYSYLQDDWRATQKLTLNLGVRYEIPFQWFEPHGHSATFIPGFQSQVFPQAPGGLAFPGDKGVLSSLVPTDFNGIAPRFGFAYDVSGTGKFLVRGGYGVFFDTVNANVVGVGEPYHFQITATTPLGGASAPLKYANPTTGGLLTIPGPFDPAHPVFQAPYSIFFPNPHFRTPYVQAANFGFQYHIPRAGVLEANYVGKFSRKLTIPLDLNPAIYDCSGGYFQASPSTYCGNNASSAVTSTQSRLRYADFNYGGQGIVDILSVGTANYNGLQVQYTQRGGKLLTIQSSYTYSRSIDRSTVERSDGVERCAECVQHCIGQGAI